MRAFPKYILIFLLIIVTMILLAIAGIGYEFKKTSSRMDAYTCKQFEEDIVKPNPANILAISTVSTAYLNNYMNMRTTEDAAHGLEKMKDEEIKLIVQKAYQRCKDNPDKKIMDIFTSDTAPSIVPAAVSTTITEPSPTAVKE